MSEVAAGSGRASVAGNKRARVTVADRTSPAISNANNANAESNGRAGCRMSAPQDLTPTAPGLQPFEGAGEGSGQHIVDVPHTGLPSNNGAHTMSVKDARLKDEYTNSVQAIRDFIDSSKLMQYMSGSALPDDVLAELKCLLSRVNRACFQVMRPETPSVLGVIAKDFHTATVADWEVDKSHWIKALAKLRLSDEQVRPQRRPTSSPATEEHERLCDQHQRLGHQRLGHQRLGRTDHVAAYAAVLAVRHPCALYAAFRLAQHVPRTPGM